MVKNMTTRVSIDHFVIKVPKLVQIIVTIIEYRLIMYPLSIKDGCQKSKIPATKFSFLTFPHQTAVISHASSSSSSFVQFFHIYFNEKGKLNKISLFISLTFKFVICTHHYDLRTKIFKEMYKPIARIHIQKSVFFTVY